MKKRLTELHILQPIVNGGVNRDENGALKTATIGGYDRLRISSQSWKRAIREFAKSLNPELFGGFRTRYLPGMVSDALLKAGLDAEKAAKIGPNVAGIVANGKVDPKNAERVTGLAFISSREIEHIATGIKSDAELTKSLLGTPKKESKKKVTDLWADAPVSADVALFGRMVADAATCTVTAASWYSHAIGVDRLTRDFDFYSALDDLQPADVSGAGFTGLREIGTSLVYRYAALGRDQLIENMDSEGPETIDMVVSDWIQATISAIPGGNRAGQNTDTYPLHVVAVTQDNHRGASAVGTFIDPVRDNGAGLTDAAIERMDTHLAGLIRFAPDMNIRAMGTDETLTDFIGTVTGETS